MALQLTASSLRKEVARVRADLPATLPYAMTSGASFATAGLLKMMRPGGLKTLASIGAFVGGGFFAAKSRDRSGKAIAVGIAGGGLWSLIMRA